MSGNMNNMDKYSRFYRNHMTNAHAEALKDIAEQANGASDAVLQAAEAIANEFLEQQQMEQNQEVPKEVSALSNEELDKAIKEAMSESDTTVGVIGEDSLMAQYVEAAKAKEADAETTETVVEENTVEETVSEEPVEEKSEEVKEEAVSLEEALPEIYTLSKVVYQAYATAKAVGGRLFSSLTAPSYEAAQKKWELFCLFAEHNGKLDALKELNDYQKVKILGSLFDADKFSKKEPIIIYNVLDDKFNTIEYQPGMNGLRDSVKLIRDVDDVKFYDYRDFGAGLTSDHSQVLRIIADQL